MVALLGVILTAGCASAWVTPTIPPFDQKTGAARSTSTSAMHPRRSEATVMPTRGDRVVPTSTPVVPQLSPLVSGDNPLQFWADSNDINALLAEGEYLWAATGGGVVRWHTTTGEYQLFSTRDGLASQATRGIAQDADGHIWVGHADQGAWSEYDGQSWHSWEREAAVNARYQALLQARHLDPRLWSARAESTWVWLPTADGQVAAYDGQEWYTYGESEGVRRDTWLVAVSAQGRVWAIGDGISTTAEGDRWWQDHGFFAGVPRDSRAADIALDDRGGIWVAFSSPSGSGGLGYLDMGANRWTGYDHALNPMIPRQVCRLQLDADGTLWLGGEEAISYRRPGGRWQSISLGPITAQSLLRDPEGRFWVGTAYGLWSISADGGERRGPWLLPSSLLGNQVLALARERDLLWIGTSRGVTYAALAAQGAGKTGILTSEAPLCLALSPAQDLWLATRSGLIIVRDDMSRELALDATVRAIAFDPSGRPWVGTEGGQIERRGNDGWEVVASIPDLAGGSLRRMVIGRDGSAWLATSLGPGVVSPEAKFSWLQGEEGLPNADARSLALGQDDTLWVATAEGLARRSPSGEWALLTVTSTEGGLRSADTRDVLLDHEGALWITTAAGISLRSPEADWFYFDLPGVLSVWPEPSGEVWLGTSGGLYYLQRKELVAVP